MGQRPNLFEKLIANVQRGASNLHSNRKTSKEAVWSPRSHHMQQHVAPLSTAGERGRAAQSRPPLSLAEQSATDNATECTSGQLALSEAMPVSENSHLVIGRGVKLIGEISNCETLVVDGEVEAKNDSRMLKIASNGSFKGTVNVDVAEIYGRFEGELVARKKLVVYATGSVIGQVSYGKLVIEEGGRISGNMTAALPAADSGISAPVSRVAGDGQYSNSELISGKMHTAFAKTVIR